MWPEIFPVVVLFIFIDVERSALLFSKRSKVTEVSVTPRIHDEWEQRRRFRWRVGRERRGATCPPRGPPTPKFDPARSLFQLCGASTTTWPTAENITDWSAVVLSRVRDAHGIPFRIRIAQVDQSAMFSAVGQAVVSLFGYGISPKWHSSALPPRLSSRLSLANWHTYPSNDVP